MLKKINFQIGSQDKTVKLWNINSGKILNTLPEYSDVVRCVQFNEHQVVSGLEDGVCKIINIDEGEQKFVAHKDAKLTCLQFDSNKLVTGSSDSTIKVWNPRTGQFKYSLNPPESAGWVRCLRFEEEKLISGHGDNMIRVWSFK